MTRCCSSGGRTGGGSLSSPWSALLPLTSSPVNYVMLALFVVCSFLAVPSHSVAVISIDLGNDFYKIGLVKPGVPMEIVLNSESKRKTPTVVTLKSDERLFGDPAMNAGIRKPNTMFTHFLDLIGKPIDHPTVETYKSRFPHHKLVATERDTVQFKLNEDAFYTVEELLAMLLNNSRNLASDFAQDYVTSAIVTVPAYFTQAERRAVKNAVEICGLKLLQLMSDNAAVALNYGIFRRDEFKDTSTHIMFFDMGASATKASVVEYKTDKIIENGKAELHPHLYIRGFGYDRKLGGSEFDFRLRDYLAEQFTKQKKTSVPIKESPKAMAKLLKEANRVKQVLSANTEHYAQVEGLHEEQDFRCQVTRTIMDELCADLYERVKEPIDMALKMADISLENIESFIVFGGSFRVPRVQDKLLEILDGKKEISKNINADEAAALGSVYQAAFLSSAFRVKRFVAKDASVFPIDVSFDRVYTDESDGQTKIKSVDRTIFNKMNAYPIKKAMTFNRMNDDFSFSMKYSNLNFVPESELSRLGPTNLATVAVSGVKEIYDKNMKEENVTDKGVKAHFKLDDSGMIEIVGIESNFEKVVFEEKNVTVKSEKSTIEKLTDSISNFFGNKEKKGEGEGEGESDQPSEDIPDEKPEKQEEEKEKKDSTETEKPTESKETTENKTSSNDTETKNGTEVPTEIIEKKVEEKLVPVKENLKFTIEIKDSILMTEADIKKSKEKLTQLTLRDQEKLETAKALNDLESFIIGQQEKLDDNENAAKVTSETERAELFGKLSAASEWLYDEGIGLSSVEYKAKLAELKKEFKPVFTRLQEMSERPKVVAALLDIINRTETFLNISSKMPEDSQIFTPVEIETLNKSLIETQGFLKESLKTIEEANPHDMPPVLVSDMKAKYSNLERDLMYLVNKMRYAKPKPKTTKAPEKNSTDGPDVEEDNEEEEEKSAEDSGEKKTEADEKPETLELPGADPETPESATEQPNEPSENDDSTPRTDL